MLFKKNIIPVLFIVVSLIFIAGCGGGGGGSSSGGGSVSNSGIVTKSITLSWESPSTNADGSPISDLAGFKVYYGQGSLVNSVDVGSLTEATINNLSAGTWCFGTTAYDYSGNESDLSNQICTEIT